MRVSGLLAVVVLVALAQFAPASAGTITPGFTYTVADDFTGASFVGTHYHSNTGGAFGNPAGLAEVGGFFSTEECRGLSEYNLAGLSTATTAFVTFDVYMLGGLFGQTPGDFDIDIFSYVGNNLENFADYQAATTGSVAAFGTGGLLVGNTLSFDITSIFNTAIGNGDASLGIRLQQDVRNTSGPAIVFNNFRLTTDNQTTAAVPLPGAATSGLLSLFGLGLLGVARRRRRVRG